MPLRIEKVSLPSASPGTHRSLDILHYGVPGIGYKAYVQAALHADEIPGLLVMHKLIELLDAADQAGQISGNIVLVPIANPIGLAQHLFGELAGRYEQSSGINFNRKYPDLVNQVAERVANKLCDDAQINTQRIRKTAKKVVKKQRPKDEAGVLKNLLLVNAIDADIVLDLHCDWQSVMHIYMGTPLWPTMTNLAAYLRAEAVLLEKVSGGHPFDEALSGLWWALAKRFPDKPIRNACQAATVELRGKVDTDEQQASTDAQNLFYYLQACGVIQGNPPAPEKLTVEATPLNGVEKIIAPIAGVVSYQKQPGEWVKPGEVVCVVFDITQYDAARSRIKLKATVAGIMYARRLDRLARPGQVLARIAGKHPLRAQGEGLLED